MQFNYVVTVQCSLHYIEKMQSIVEDFTNLQFVQTQISDANVPVVIGPLAGFLEAGQEVTYAQFADWWPQIFKAVSAEICTMKTMVAELQSKVSALETQQP